MSIHRQIFLTSAVIRQHRDTLYTATLRSVTRVRAIGCVLCLRGSALRFGWATGWVMGKRLFSTCLILTPTSSTCSFCVMPWWRSSLITNHGISLILIWTLQPPWAKASVLAIMAILSRAIFQDGIMRHQAVPRLYFGAIGMRWVSTLLHCTVRLLWFLCRITIVPGLHITAMLILRCKRALSASLPRAVAMRL